MTTLQIDNELASQLRLISANNDLKKKVLDYIKNLTGHAKEAKSATHDDGLIHVNRNIPLPSDRYVGIISSSREDDERDFEEYLTEKYSKE